MTRRLEFFEKDPIDWKTLELEAFYSGLLALKQNNAALANGQYGAPVLLLDAGNQQLFAFSRQLGSNKVTVAVNLSNQAQTFQLNGRMQQLAAWQWQVESSL